MQDFKIKGEGRCREGFGEGCFVVLYPVPNVFKVKRNLKVCTVPACRR